MSGCSLSQEQIERVIAFHGHWCPGLAIGIRASEYALAELGRDGDEDIVAVVETDMCGVDAIQVLTGCTFGKGNLIHRDYGKSAFTFWRRGDGKALRLVYAADHLRGPDPRMQELNQKASSGLLTAAEQEELHRLRQERSQRIMEAPLEELFRVGEPAEPLPRRARIRTSLPCERCGEMTMETRTRRLEGRTLCLPCYRALGGD